MAIDVGILLLDPEYAVKKLKWDMAYFLFRIVYFCSLSTLDKINRKSNYATLLKKDQVR
jgi:hypothetical protein